MGIYVLSDTDSAIVQSVIIGIWLIFWTFKILLGKRKTTILSVDWEKNILNLLHENTTNMGTATPKQ